MKTTGETPNHVKKIHVEGSQMSSTFHFDDSQGVPKEGMWFHVHKDATAPSNYPAGRDAAAPAGTSLSFTLPPHIGHAMPANAPDPSKKKFGGKRKETPIPFGDDDRDFVETPAPVRKASNVAVRKSKRVRSSRSEGPNNPLKRRNPNYRCAPNKIVEAKRIMTAGQQSKIRKYGFGAFLDMSLTGLENTKLLMFLMDCLDPDTVTLEFGSGKSLKITEHAIQCVLGLPNNGSNIVVPDKPKQSEALSKVKSQLGIEQGVNIKIQDLIQWIEKGGEDDFTIRCFLMIVFGKLLVPGTCDYITGKEAALTEDVPSLRWVNWPKLIYEDIAHSAKLWHSKKNAAFNPSMHGCLIFILVYYLDNLWGKCSTNPVLTPRIAHFTKKQLLNLIDEDKQVVDGVELFGALPLRSQEGTCYMDFAHPCNDIPSTSQFVPPATFFSMRQHLAGCFNGLPMELKVAGMEALQRCDDDVNSLVHQIRASQMAAVHKIRCILLDRQSYAPPPPPTADDDGANTRTARSPQLDEDAHIDTNLHPAGQCPCPSSDVAKKAAVIEDLCGNLETPQAQPQDSPLLPPTFDKTPHSYVDSLTPSVDGTENVTQVWEASQQLRAAGMQKSCAREVSLPSPIFDETPRPNTHGTQIFSKQRERDDQLRDPSHQQANARDELQHVSLPVFDETPKHPARGNENLAQQCDENIASFGKRFRNKINSPLSAKHVVRGRKMTTKKISPSKNLAAVKKSQTKVAGSQSVFYGRQPPITSRRNENLSSKLLSPLKFNLHRHDCPIPIQSALALRDIIVCDQSLAEVPLISNDALGVCTHGEALAASFKDDSTTLIEIMNFFTECIRHDEKHINPQCRGYRLFLSWPFGSMLNCEEIFQGQEYDSSLAVQHLSNHLNGVDHKHIKLILWTYHHSNHFAVYCINRVNTRIDVLDSIDWNTRGSSFEERNSPWGYRSIKRLSEAFQTFTGGEFEDFSTWPIWSKEVPRQIGNDCAFFTTKFLRHYDGQESELSFHIDPSLANQYRAEELAYIIFHELNETRPLPKSLEKFRPIINENK